MRYTYTINNIVVHGIGCHVARLYRHPTPSTRELVYETTTMTHAEGYNSIYRHWTRLAELDAIEQGSAGCSGKPSQWNTAG